MSSFLLPLHNACAHILLRYLLLLRLQGLIADRFRRPADYMAKSLNIHMQVLKCNLDVEFKTNLPIYTFDFRKRLSVFDVKNIKFTVSFFLSIPLIVIIQK